MSYVMFKFLLFTFKTCYKIFKILYTLIVRRCPEGTANGSVDRGRTGDGRRWRCPEGTAVFYLNIKFGGALRAPPFFK